MKIRISGTISESIVDGPGIRFVVFTQGCPHHCAGCHNPDTHDFNGGKVIDTDEMILRKGAIAAHSGEKVLIPINMRDGSVLAVGKGNSEWNYSAPHGAGRVMSRTKAKESIDLEEYKASMQGIYSTSVNADTLDEAPMAYKSLADIIDVIRDSVDIIDIMKPVYNFKATEGEIPWKKKGNTNEKKDTDSAS
mgnify:CR=1 FL=1